MPLCAGCRREEFDFDRSRSYGLYRAELRAAILQLKFLRRERLGVRLGELMSPLWDSFQNSGDASTDGPLLVPVPLHSSRRRARGFNQAEALARGMSRKAGTLAGRRAPRVETRCLERTRPTVPQTGLSLKARRENVRGVFRVTSPAIVRGRAVVLVDDVMTTGATLASCASALKRAGARQVFAVTLARATPQFPDASPDGRTEAVDDLGRAQT